MHCLSFKLLLACGVLSLDEPLLQCWFFWACWRRSHSVCGRKVHNINRISPLQQLSVELLIACGQLSYELQLQRWLFWA
jgi:hypothetical protein